MSTTEQHKPLAALKRWEDNYNRNDVAKIALSIRRFGFNTAPRVWRDNIVMAGNHSVMALNLIREEGAKPDLDLAYPPANVVNLAGVWFVQCIDVSHLDEVQARAFAIADNELARQATRDEALLAEYLQQIAAADEDTFLATGFDPSSLQVLIQSIAPTFEPAGEDEQQRLDQFNPIQCPCCGCEFQRDG